MVLAAGLFAVCMMPVIGWADVGPPAHLRVSERESGRYMVQWRVPTALPPRAVPVPLLPDACEPSGDVVVTDQPGAWLLTQDWQCEESVAGQSLGMRYPFPDLALTTVIRVDLLSGDRFAHVLSPGEGSWQLPEGTAAPDPVLRAQRAVVAGLSHALSSWGHLLFLVVVALLGGVVASVRLVTAFSLGQVGGAVAAVALGSGIGTGPAELGLALAVALLAREALEPDSERRSLLGLGAAAGVVHGLSIAVVLGDPINTTFAGLLSATLAILGMDAVHLVGAATLVGLWGWFSARQWAPAGSRARVAYAVGGTGMAFAIALALGGGPRGAGAEAPSLTVPESAPAGAPAAGSRRLAPAAPDAPVQSFLAVEPFEIRHEVMLRLAGLVEELDLDPGATLDIDAQPEVSRRIGELVLEAAVVLADGGSIRPMLRRADFMTVDPTGALPRPTPVPEGVSEAVVGVVVAYPTEGMPKRVTLDWRLFPAAAPTVPSTIIDPEAVTTSTLTVDDPSATWENALVEDPIPSIAAVEIEPISLPVPLLSVPLLVLAAWLLFVGFRERRTTAVAWTRVVLALAFVVGPFAQTAVALPGSGDRVPSERQARRILAGLLPNIYRALEFREEAAIYDRLAVSVTGETLTDVYLEQRRALEMEERGGAQARVEAVEVLEARDMESAETGFGVVSTWTVGGMVTHFGHRHFRQNRYLARIGIVPVADTWKIQSIEILEQERIQ